MDWVRILVTDWISRSLDILLFSLAIAKRWGSTLLQLRGQCGIGQSGNVFKNSSKGVIIRPPGQKVLPGSASTHCRIGSRTHDSEIVVVVDFFIRLGESRSWSPILSTTSVDGRQLVEDHTSPTDRASTWGVRHVFDPAGPVVTITFKFWASERIVTCKNKWNGKLRIILRTVWQSFWR